MNKNVFTACVLPIILLGIGFIMPNDTDIQIYAGYTCFVIAFLIFAFSIFFQRHSVSKFIKNAYNFISNPKKISAIPIQETNNPDLFPDLNETTLKAHIALKVNECPFGDIIQKITLYKGVVFRKQLIVEAPEDDKSFSDLQKFWERNVQDLFEKHFIEAFREKQKEILRRGFWIEWGCMVIDIGKPLPNTLVLKDPKWLLYKK